MATDSTGKRLYGAPKNWPDIFINHLAETSNIKASADAASVSQSLVYKKRRDDPAFAQRWYAALAEGYDTLEMELLERLRTGRLEDELEDGTRRKFDIGTAFKCITAHRETVMREKSRRSLADEVTTIQSINAKIDRLRERQQQAEALAARRAARAAGSHDE
ncbi:hypothetical protein ACOYW6_09200 [Parablastomonas sp. CN1-191]|uniref:hypothetical protein n=1 Tax=Parablastomonas sp. CN1-191 TaxID=3400908 RepID=UPI003BF7C798